jgi:drug/metabolite transporter (DMT)-like permease
MIVGIVAISFSSIFVKQLELMGVPLLVAAFYRMSLAVLLLLPALVLSRNSATARWNRHELAWLILAGFCLAVHFGAWMLSFKYISIATSVLIVNTHPLIVTLAAWGLLGESPTWRSLVGTSIGMLGTIVIFWHDWQTFELALRGDALAFLGALAVAAYFLIGRKLRARIGLLDYVTPLYAVCSAFLLIGVLVSGSSLYPYPPRTWIYFLALAVVPTIFGHTVFNWSLKHVRASAVSLAFLGEPVMASVLALLIFRQSPARATLAGGALILLGIYLAVSAKN